MGAATRPRLDAMAKALEITKQSILYWFPSKDALLRR